jgi:predicted O-methyltransferase YrrM
MIKHKKNIDNCTLFVADCVDPRLAIKALEKTCEHLNFKEVILFAHQKPFNIKSNIKFIQIEKLNNLADYCKFMIYQLPNYIVTEFAFSVHRDGFVISPDRWTDEFLKYDYIGAPWKATAHYTDKNHRVGNGGVSIRSKRLMDIVQKLPCGGHEDTDICVGHRAFLEKNGITFAPLELASAFSIEMVCEDLDHNIQKTLAFHGAHTSEHIQHIKDLQMNFYRDDIINMSTEQLEVWVRDEAGSQLPHYFYCNTPGNLQLQQIPEEYSKFLSYIKHRNIKTYLELGVGNGGSFFVNSLFLQSTAKILHCVDNIAYRDTHVQQTPEKIQAKVDILKKMFPSKEVCFFNSSTDNFFANNTKNYDCIFIDADHTYEGVKADYENALKCVNKNGFLIFHDIGNMGDGIGKFWEEIKHNYNYIEFKHKADHVNFYNCGIGILEIQ